MTILINLIWVNNYMMNFIMKIADFNFKISNNLLNFKTRFNMYFTNDKKIDCELLVTHNDLHNEISLSEFKSSDKYIEFVCISRKIADWLPLHNAFVLHSATFEVDGTGVAFAAHSGTGKTTHMRLWQELLGKRMTVVNGDKPIVRFFEDEPECPYAYGTPWNGKERLGCNMRTPLKHICFIERSEKNSCEPMDKKDAVDLMFNQVYMPTDPQAALCTMQLIDRLLSCCKLWKIRCNMEPNAAEVAYNTIWE